MIEERLLGELLLKEFGYSLIIDKNKFELFADIVKDSSLVGCIMFGNGIVRYPLEFECVILSHIHQQCTVMLKILIKIHDKKR